MKIIKKPSPNYNSRVQLIMLHATGIPLQQSFDDRLIGGPVSCHYVVDENGDIYQLVDDEKRAWHAGVGYWRGITDINSAAIGIELVKPSDDEIDTGAALPEKQFHNCIYGEAQMNALLKLFKNLLTKHERVRDRHYNIISHQDATPDKKFDPGPNFDWQYLAKNGVGLWHDLSEEEMADVSPLSASEAQDCLTLLKDYGYDLRDPSEGQIKHVVTAFQTHFLPNQISGTLTAGTYKAIQSLTKKTS